MAAAESMAAGVPVIGFSDCPGMKDLLTHNHSGWLVETVSATGRVDALKEGLSVLMGDASLRSSLGQNGRWSVGAFDPGLIVGRWETLLARVTDGTGRN
jgi:glycosyltransferase involved in cell wall biosynthesis